MSALDGIQVLDLTDPKGHFSGKLLAGLGADVIKIEPTAGDIGRQYGPFLDDQPGPERSLYWWHYGAGRRSVALDLDCNDGIELFLQLAQDADVILESWQPGRARPFDPIALSEQLPELVVLSLTPFGQTGPWRDHAWSDAVGLALGGPMGSCGYDNIPDTPPIRPTEHHAGHIAGYFAAAGVCSALFERQASGLGQHLDISMHECMGFTIESSAPWALYERHPLIRQAGRHAGPQPTEPWQYPTADGRLINIFGMPRSEASWLALVGFIQEHGMGERLSDIELLDGRKRQLGLQQPTVAVMLAEIADFIAAHEAEEIYAGAQAAGAAWSIIRTPDECLADEHWRARGFFVDVEHEERGRTVTFPGAPYILSETPWTHGRRAPMLGEHTTEVLCGQLGLSASEVGSLMAAGIVR